MNFNNMNFCFNSPCEAVTALTALAVTIARGKSEDEVTLLGTYFTQLGDTLLTYAAVDTICCDDRMDQTFQ
ncbi:DUF6774 domain-containing protein [[Clostridium] polysaccharolyticum]|uniref:DUF6774 domain-containing protein n=1 Tax=[Clostridium] polysaccharolyticum TaxID=29364 RepID=A0A1I0G608_9FIRM|nr:DUF6774 domain-containing protein [[Clostridium] polysaccharolyticum]SET65487.1 hypothetical protein SAMN04487772_14612 [[Clostridium] polysaccharolyticum]